MRVKIILSLLAVMALLAFSGCKDPAPQLGYNELGEPA